MREKKTRSLKWKLISIMLLYWVLPFVMIIGIIGLYLLTSQEKNQMERLLTQAQLNTETCAERLNGAVADSRQATYDRTLFEKYREYQRNLISERAFSNAAQNYLNNQYAHKKNNIFAVLMLTEDPYDKRYTCYNYQTGGDYERIRSFYARDCEDVLELAEELDTAVGFVKCGDELYVVRNMMDRNFRPWGILVNQVNMDYCFETLTSSWEDFSVCVRLNGKEVISPDDGEADWAAFEEMDEGEEGTYALENGGVYACCQVKDDDFTLRFLLYTTQKALFTPLYGYLYVTFAMIFFLLPMLVLFFWLSRKYLSRPVNALMSCAEEIEKGNLGYQMDENMGSLEFEYLQESMNRMSGRLKYQFDHIYEEELALRDAKIMALQSHINPHFMNNTLEIINWEARLSGCEKVSRMIEALSTLMDAAMDRKKLPEVTLAEEMVYVNAYFYISSQRLGKRLRVEKDIPEEILKLMVPRLIMQPIIENAIEHGIVPRGEGCVRIAGRREGGFLYLQIINDGELTKKAEEKIARLLSPDYDASRETSGNLGIANVNQRIRILYGDECGLTIRQCDGGKTVSTLKILI